MPDGVSAHNAWKQRGRRFQTVPAEMGLKWVKKKKKKKKTGDDYHFTVWRLSEKQLFFLGQRVCVFRFIKA